MSANEQKMTKPSHVEFKLDQQNLVDQDQDIQSHSYQTSGQRIATRSLYFLHVMINPLQSVHLFHSFKQVIHYLTNLPSSLSHTV